MPRIIRRYYETVIYDMTDPDLFRVARLEDLFQIWEMSGFRDAYGYDKRGVRRAFLGPGNHLGLAVQTFGARGSVYRRELLMLGEIQDLWHVRDRFASYAWNIPHPVWTHSLNALAAQAVMLPNIELSHT